MTYFFIEDNSPGVAEDGVATFAVLQKCDEISAKLNRFEICIPDHDPANIFFIKTAIMLHVYAAYAIVNDPDCDMDELVHTDTFVEYLDATIAKLVSAAAAIA